MSKWIDADVLVQNIVKRLCIRSEEYLTAQESVIVSEIYNAPSIDLVRCAECKHCKLDVVVERRVSGYERSINICHHPRYLLELAVEKDWYCADGERKENK